METGNNRTLCIFIDESGNFDFSPTGTKHFVLTSVSTTEPLKDREQFLKLRYELLREGRNQEHFHATEDKQKVRDLMFSALAGLEDFEVDAVLVQKSQVDSKFYLETKRGRERHTGEGIYKLLSQTLLKDIFSRYETLDHIDRIIVVLGSIFSKNKKELVLKSLKQYLKKKTKKQFYIYFHKVEADINCQLADYCGWAIYVDAERNEKRPLKVIKNKVKSIIDISSQTELKK
tara:strand:+ start:176 stop:871 length:696 start_codon:yes stop_codon:yes gene_type:complete